MTQTRLPKTNIRVNWVKDHVQACELDSGVIEKNCVDIPQENALNDRLHYHNHPSSSYYPSLAYRKNSASWDPPLVSHATGADC